MSSSPKVQRAAARKKVGASSAAPGKPCQELLKLRKDARALRGAVRGKNDTISELQRRLENLKRAEADGQVSKKKCENLQEELVAARRLASFWKGLAESRSAELKREGSRMDLAEQFLTDLRAKVERAERLIGTLREELAEAEKTSEMHLSAALEVLRAAERCCSGNAQSLRAADERFAESARLAEKSAEMAAAARRELRDACGRLKAARSEILGGSQSLGAASLVDSLRAATPADRAPTVEAGLVEGAEGRGAKRGNDAASDGLSSEEEGAPQVTSCRRARMPPPGRWARRSERRCRAAPRAEWPSAAVCADSFCSKVRRRSPRKKMGTLWTDYYAKFPYFDNGNAVRPACGPIITESDDCTKGIVLVHGLTDSPYYMGALASHFRKLNYNVYLPLLAGHGLRDPKGMEDVRLEDWKDNVRFALDTAAKKNRQVSIGGFSTGGALALYMAATHRKINGAVYLFSAALDAQGGLVGELTKMLLRSPLRDWFDSNDTLIGENPYRYTRVDVDGAAQVTRLMKENDAIICDARQRLLDLRVFAAHSECDTMCDIKGVEALQQVINNREQFVFYRIPKALGVTHESLVLKDPVVYKNKELEPRNPEFSKIEDAITEFESK
jgi:esterase/lipase